MKQFKKIVLFMALAVIMAMSVFAADDLFWGFDIDNEFDGWSRTNCTGTVKDGYIAGQAVTNQVGSYDPFISHSVEFAASDYKYIVFSMKYENERALSNSSSLFFATDTKGLSEATRVGLPSLQGKTSDGKYIVQVFDMSVNENWTGTIKTLRLDMLSGASSYSIDYVKVTNTLPEQFDNINSGSSAAGSATKAEFEFKKQNSYTDGMFADVAAADWYNKSVGGAYELGFMNGTGTNVFSPMGNMTVAQAITIAARIHSLYNSVQADFTPAEGAVWYAPYVKYAEDNKFFEAVSFDSFDRNVKRWEMAVLFGSVLPEKWLPAINNVGFIPDVATDASYKASILALYNAGILMGSDSYGTFKPDNDITRAEAAAIINRLAIKSQRITGKLELNASLLSTKDLTETGYYLIDNPTMYYGAEGLQEAWDYYGGGAKPNPTGLTSNTLDDLSETDYTFIKRDITEQTSGVVDLSVNFKMDYSYGGVVFTLYDRDGKKAVEIYSKNGNFYTKSGDTEINTGYKVVLNKNIWLDATVDLDSKKFDLFFNGTYYGSYPFAGAVSGIKALEISTSKEDTPMIVVQSVFMRKNYYMADDFNSGEYTAAKVTADDGVTVTTAGTFKAAVRKGNKFEAAYDFTAATGNLCFQTMFHADKLPDGLTFALTGASENVLSLTTKGGKFVTGAGVTLEKDIVSNLWNLLRVEANTETDKAVIKLNGKVIGEVAFDKASDSISGLKVSCTASADAVIQLDEAYVTELFEYADYCPAPVVNESKDYILGINMCSLWREGYHRGWGPISPYEEVIPVLGFYDEGIPEVSDWEIKYMAEHGIDYQLLCWYGDGRKGSVKLGRGSASAIHDGYFNAKYSDKVKFAIMWENASNSTSLEAFKTNVLPYWVEYYLSDPRYMTVKNKPVVTVWSNGGLKTSMGGADKVNEAIALLDAACVELGYDGVLFMCADGHSTRADQFRNLASTNAAATYAYHWNTGGVKYYSQTGRMNNYLKYNADPSVPSEEKIPLVPTVSVGFNSVGWHRNRTGLIDDEGWQNVAQYAKENVLPTLEGTDMENMVIISTWNEYGEGHYMMPSEGLGFKYLKNVAKAFTANAEPKEVVPTASQKARLGYLYPDDRYVLAPMLEADISEYPQTVEHQIKFEEKDFVNYEMYSLGGTQHINDFGNFVASPAGNGIVFNKNPLDINIDNCSYIRVTIKGEKPTSVADTLTGYFFFATDKYPVVEEPTRTAFSYPNGGDMATYYIDMSKNSRWHGTLKTLRIDPLSNGTFEIESIEILRDDAKIPVKVNGSNIKTYGVPNTDNNQLLIPAYPDYGTFTALGATHTWNKATKTLTVFGNGHTVVMTVGSDKAIVDGKEETMYTKLELFDNLPLLPYDLLAQYLGHTYERTETAINITTNK